MRKKKGGWEEKRKVISKTEGGMCGIDLSVKRTKIATSLFFRKKKTQIYTSSICRPKKERTTKLITKIFIYLEDLELQTLQQQHVSLRDLSYLPVKLFKYMKEEN